MYKQHWHIQTPLCRRVGESEMQRMTGEQAPLVRVMAPWTAGTWCEGPDVGQADQAHVLWGICLHDSIYGLVCSGIMEHISS